MGLKSVNEPYSPSGSSAIGNDQVCVLEMFLATGAASAPAECGTGATSVFFRNSLTPSDCSDEQGAVAGQL